MWHLLRTMLPADDIVMTMAATPTQREFVEAVGGLPKHIERSGRSMWLNARGFSEELGLSGTCTTLINDTNLRVHVCGIS